VLFVAWLTLFFPVVCDAQVYAGATVGAGGASVPFGSTVGGFRGALRLFGGYEFGRHNFMRRLTLGLETAVSHVGFGPPIDDRRKVNWTAFTTTYRFW
jgi:hypothetical protein